MQIKNLNPNKKNPRKISQKKLDVLKKSLSKFGDLSGFVYNTRTDTLISGHQRQKSLPPDAKIKITEKYETPTKARTTAEGFVLVDGEKFKYREVDADLTWEMEALLAANKHSGEWDKDLLKLAVIDLPELDLELAGFDDIEIKNLDLSLPDYPSKHYDDDGEIDEEKIEEEEESDEEYLENNPGPDSAVEKERIPSMVNEEKQPSPFDEVNEVTELVNKRIVIIIDCPNEETKQRLRELLRENVEKENCKFF